MRIAVAEIAQETDSFSPMTADIKDFETYGLFFGVEILERMQGVGPIGGLLDVVAERAEPVELFPITPSLLHAPRASFLNSDAISSEVGDW